MGNVRGKPCLIYGVPEKEGWACERLGRHSCLSSAVFDAIEPLFGRTSAVEDVASNGVKSFTQDDIVICDLLR